MSIKLEDLGYNDFFEVKRKEIDSNDFLVARVTSQHKGGYEVINQDGRFSAKITGKQMYDATSKEDYPAVGDWVLIKQADNEQVIIYGILPRKSIIKRKKGEKKIQLIGANIDVAFIVESIDRDYSLNRFERYFAILKEQEIKPIIILNKIDLISEKEINDLIFQIQERFNNIDVILTSTLNDEGLDKLKLQIQKGKTYCFLGSSGVGKSSLINKLIGEDILKTGEISSYSDRGKHVTTKREMYFLKNGGIVIDNPGIREVGVADDSKGVIDVFDEIAELAENCKYRDCTHINEPGCAVLRAIEEGRLDKEQYNNYINIKKESEHYEMSDLEKREKNRNFGKFIKKAKKDIERYKS
jgi:ribosome biogenesis GTPase